MNSFGQLYRLTSFGESHGKGIGGIIDGCPAGIEVDIDFIQNELNRRKPGQSKLVTQRKEGDVVEFLSGIFEGKTTGTPIGFVVRNDDQHSSDYDNLRDIFRPSHADYTYFSKYGIRDHRGGGRSSARETIARCVAGALAKLILRQPGVSINAYTSQVGTICLPFDYTHYDLSVAECNAVRCPDPEIAEQMSSFIQKIKSEGDTVGGVITCVIRGVPAGWGEPVFDKLQAQLASAMLGINAVKGFEYGGGFEVSKFRGSEINDVFCIKEGKVTTKSNFSGGIQGGISNGEDIYFRVAFKPVATLLRDQSTVNIHNEEVLFKARGRHDPCVLPRAVPIVEAMAAMVLADNFLAQRARFGFA